LHRYLDVSDQGERGRHAWHEAQRFYRQDGFQLAWSDGQRPRPPLESPRRRISVLKTVPDVYGIDRAPIAAATTQ
jgi:hypothetical protein